MSKLFFVISKFLLASSVVLSLWLLIVNPVSFNREYFFVPLFILAIVCLGIFTPNGYYQKVHQFFASRPLLIKACVVVVIILSLAARFSFLAFEYQPISDPVMVFHAARNLASDGSLDGSLGNFTRYNATFPYLFSYNALLGGAMTIFGTGVFAVIMLNTLLDMVAVVLLYILVKRVSRNDKTAKIAALLWLVSPFNIIFSAISLSIIAVNTGIIAAMLLVHLTISSLSDLKKLIPLSLATGLVFSLVNAFRPIMVVFVIALVIYYVLIYLSKVKTGGGPFFAAWQCPSV